MRGFLFAFILAVCLLPGACLSATEVNVLVMTDLRCPGTAPDGTPLLERTDVLVLKDGMPQTVGSTTQCVNGRVGNIVFVPGQSEQIHLRVEGIVRDHPRPLDADRILRFLPHQSLDLTVELNAACVDVVCTGIQTCVKGQCVDPPETGGDAGLDDAMTGSTDGATSDSTLFDVKPDGVLFDSGADVVPPDGTTLDSGSCLFSLASPDAYWSFDEMMSPIVEKYSMMSTAVKSPFSLGAGACRGALYAPSPSTPMALLGTSSWKPTSLRIGFYVRIASGAGNLVERGSQYTGGWVFKFSNSAITFAITGAGQITAALTTPINWHTVVGSYKSAQFTLFIDGAPAMPTSGSIMQLGNITADTMVGSSGLSAGIDELYLAQ